MPHLAILLAFVLLVGGSYVVGRWDGKQLCAAASLKEEAVARAATDAAASAAANAIARMKVRNVTVRQELEREVREVPVYRDCRHSPDGLRHINEALAGGTVAPDSSVVPGSGATR
jgi:predicted nucleic acid-binding protein